MSFIDWELKNFPQNFGKLRCSTVIDRQTLTHVICNMDSPEGVERDVFARVMSEVAKTLDKVPFCDIEQQSEWISVKDRLPEEGTPVIALCRHDGLPGVWYWATEFTTHKSNMWHDGTARYWFPLPPLPEPPKEEPT